MRIVIDLQSAQSESRSRGVSRYSLSLTQAIAKAAQDHEIWIALNATLFENTDTLRETLSAVLPHHRIRLFDIPTPVSQMNPSHLKRSQAAEILRERFLRNLKPDVLYITSLFEGYGDDAVTSISPHLKPTNTAVTLYDLIPLLNQKQYLPHFAHRNYYRRKINDLQQADLLCAISEASRIEAMHSLEVPPEKIINISAAIDECFKPIILSSARIHQLREQYQLTRNLILCVPGGFDARKNIERLIQAYALLPNTIRKTHQLVIASHLPPKHPEQLEQIRKKAKLNQDELILTGFVPNETLVELYNLAELFVFPSLHEGFGLPVLEAMACGAPTIGSNQSSIPEVIALPEALFDPNSAQAIATKITEVLSNPTLKMYLKQHGLARSKAFSWESCAKRTLEGFEALVNQSPPLHAISSSLDTLQPIFSKLKPLDQYQLLPCLTYNEIKPSKRQLLLDISVLVKDDGKTGIQRVVRSLLTELLTYPPQEFEVHLIYFNNVRYYYANEFTSRCINQIRHETDSPVDFFQDDIYLALDLTASHIPFSTYQHLKQRGIHLYFIIYDLLFAHRPDWWPREVPPLLLQWLKEITQVATGAICISHTVAEDIRQWIIKNPPDRSTPLQISSFHLGADIENSAPSKGLPNNAHFILSTLKKNPSFLMVSTLEPRKGHAQTLSAFEILWQEKLPFNLVIVGKKGWLVDALVERITKHPELNKRLFWLESISDEYLTLIYNASICLIAASEGEGFGLPLIEAAKHELNILARDLPVFREVLQDNAHYFSGLDPEPLATAIQDWLLLHHENNVPQSRHLKWLTWHQSAEQLKKAILEL